MAGASFLGALLGLANLVFIAFGLHATYVDVSTSMVFTIGLIPALLTGAAVGLVAGGTREAPPTQRRIAIAAPALAVVALLGSAFALERFILLACIPTLVAAFALEQATRAPDYVIAARMVEAAPIQSRRSWVRPVLLGVVLGWTNILVGMLALALSPRCFTHETTAVMDRVELFAVVPAIAIGAGLGALAHALHAATPAARRVVLVTLTVSALWLVAASAGLQTFAFPASIPAVVSALVLERFSRSHAPDALPAARLHIH
jgi:hypothetical protein